MDPLVEQFAKSQPAEFARVLAAHATDEVRDVITTLPPVIASPVVARLGSLKLHDMLNRLPDDVVARLLLVADQSALIAILSHLPESRYASIRAAGPDEGKKALARILDVPLKTLSSIASPNFIRVEAHATCGHVLHGLTSNDELSAQSIVVADSLGKYIGIVRPLSLVPASRARRPVSDLMERVEPLPGQTPVRAARDAIQWHKWSTLPVVDLENRVLGVVDYDHLLAAIHSSDPGVPGLDDVLEQAAIGYFEVCSDLLDIGIGRREL